MFTINCSYIQNQLGKAGKLWCFDYEFPNGTCIEDEPLLDSASNLINALLKQKYGEEKIKEIQDGIIKVEFSIDEYQIDYDIRLKAWKHPSIDEPAGGSVYHCLDYLQLEDYLSKEEDSYIWLCPVLHDFYPKELPEMMYVTVTSLSINQGVEPGVQPKAVALDK